MSYDRRRRRVTRQRFPTNLPTSASSEHLRHFLATNLLRATTSLEHTYRGASLCSYFFRQHMPYIMLHNISDIHLSVCRQQYAIFIIPLELRTQVL